MDCTNRFLDVLPRVSDYLELPDFTSAIAVNDRVLQSATNGDIPYVQPAAVSAMAAAHSLKSNSDDALCVRVTLLSLINIDLHVRAGSSIVLQHALVHALRALSRAVRLRVKVVGPRLDVLVQALLQCGHGWQDLTHLEIDVEEGRLSFPCSRDLLPWQCSFADTKRLFERKAWPSLQRVVLRGRWECPRCVRWVAGLSSQDLKDDALTRSSCSFQWDFPE